MSFLAVVVLRVCVGFVFKEYYLAVAVVSPDSSYPPLPVLFPPL